MRTKLTLHARRMIVEAYRSGELVKLIAARFKINESSVVRVAMQEGATPRMPRCQNES